MEMKETVKMITRTLYVWGAMFVVLGLILINQYKTAKEADFTDQHIAWIVPQTSYYHTYGCEEFDRANFIAYNIKTAENRGYRPCPVCHGESKVK